MSLLFLNELDFCSLIYKLHINKSFLWFSIIFKKIGKTPESTFENCCSIILTETAWYWHQNRYIHWWLMEQNGKPRSEFTANWFLAKVPNTYIGEVLGKLDTHVQKTDPPISHPAQKSAQNESKILMWDLKLLEENKGEILQDIDTGNNFLDTTPKSTEIKSKNRQMGLHQTKKLLHSIGKQFRVKRQPT
jgi:hypothetical protein